MKRYNSEVELNIMVMWYTSPLHVQEIFSLEAILTGIVQGFPDIFQVQCLKNRPQLPS
jgi:hypothetical protein